MAMAGTASSSTVFGSVLVVCGVIGLKSLVTTARSRAWGFHWEVDNDEYDRTDEINDAGHLRTIDVQSSMLAFSYEALHPARKL